MEKLEQIEEKTKLTSENVEKIFMGCLFEDGENTDVHVIGNGVITKVGFNPERLKEYEPKIIDMLSDLPDSFKESSGGGMSFLNMCQDKDDNQWSGQHSIMDMLVCLGNAINKVSFNLPRDMWNLLPGGMPYILVKE